MAADISPSDYKDIIDWDVLGEIISMDEDNPEFSQNLISTFINQVLDTFHKIDDILCQIIPNDIDYQKYSNKISNTNYIDVPDEFSEMAQPPPQQQKFDDSAFDTEYTTDITLSKEIQHELKLNEEKNLSKIKNPKNIKIQLNGISELGHYIKGSASSLGFYTLQKYCERIQNYGNYLDHDGFQVTPENDQYFKDIDANYDGYLTRLTARVNPTSKDSDELWVFMVKNSLDNAKTEFNKIRDFLRKYYKDERF
ncbi:hypothetical protein DASC09_034050 [Saccharomycopsis crataegensis]|uniref:HPt domain-containing protein n=1 Tax=Saccharomycopsis crataegensis TaxID=43959 RepID=A0AAV5QP33_9ASCO|nr:hypothetical protein DASC09_034050 [Saccharomycopsis crataegensis]